MQHRKMLDWKMHDLENTRLKCNTWNTIVQHTHAYQRTIIGCSAVQSASGAIRFRTEEDYDTKKQDTTSATSLVRGLLVAATGPVRTRPFLFLCRCRYKNGEQLSIVRTPIDMVLCSFN